MEDVNFTRYFTDKESSDIEIEEEALSKVDSSKIEIKDKVLNCEYLSKNHEFKEDVRDIVEVNIGRFPGNLDDLIKVLGGFESLEVVNIDKLVSIYYFDIPYGGLPFKLRIKNCSAITGKVTTSNCDIKIENSLFSKKVYRRLSGCGISCKNLFDDILDSKLDDNGDLKDTIVCDNVKRFNRVDIFNKIFNTRLRSIGSFQLDIKVEDEKRNNLIESTNYGLICNATPGKYECFISLTLNGKDSEDDNTFLDYGTFGGNIVFETNEGLSNE